MSRWTYQTQEECDRQLRAWALLADKRPPVLRGYTQAPDVDIQTLEREAMEGRKIMEQHLKGISHAE